MIVRKHYEYSSTDNFLAGVGKLFHGLATFFSFFDSFKVLSKDKFLFGINSLLGFISNYRAYNIASKLKEFNNYKYLVDDEKLIEGKFDRVFKEDKNNIETDKYVIPAIYFLTNFAVGCLINFEIRKNPNLKFGNMEIPKEGIDLFSPGYLVVNSISPLIAFANFNKVSAMKNTFDSAEEKRKSSVQMSKGNSFIAKEVNKEELDINKVLKKAKI